MLTLRDAPERPAGSPPVLWCPELFFCEYNNLIPEE